MINEDGCLLEADSAVGSARNADLSFVLDGVPGGCSMTTSIWIIHWRDVIFCNIYTANFSVKRCVIVQIFVQNVCNGSEMKTVIELHSGKFLNGRTLWNYYNPIR